MARQCTTSNGYAVTPASIDTSATSQDTPDSSYGSPSRVGLSFGEADASRSGGLRAIERLRKRLDAIDEHSRELRSARHILIRREQLLVSERDELAESLNSIEVALMARLPSCAGGVAHQYFACDTSDKLIEDNEDFELPSKRQAVSDLSDRPTVRKRPSGSRGQEAVANQSTSKPTPLTALRTEPTLITECPSHLLQPSKSLPRPPSSSPPASSLKTPAPSTYSRSITRNGIRFPPGSAPRLSRSRSSSPLTQMLPPPVPASPTTPIAKKGYNPIIRGLSPPEFESPTACVGFVATRNTAITAPQSKLTSENGHDHANLPRLSRPHNGTIPIYLMLNSSSSGWSPTRMDPERTPSPPIGAPRSSWAVRPDVHGKCEQSGERADLEAHEVKHTNEKVGYRQDGPASRTRARVNGGGATSKGKGRV